MDNLESALRDQAENPGSCKVSPLSCGAPEWIFATLGYKDVAVRKKICAVDALSTIRLASITRIRPQESARCEIVRSVQTLEARMGSGGISSVDILPPGFGDADVATEHKQSNRRDRCRQRKDKPHGPGMSRTVRGTKGG